MIFNNFNELMIENNFNKFLLNFLKIYLKLIFEQKFKLWINYEIFEKYLKAY